MPARRRKKSRGGTQRGSRASLVGGPAGQVLGCRLCSAVVEELVELLEEGEEEGAVLLEFGEAGVPAPSSRSSTPLGTSSSRKYSPSSTARDHLPLRGEMSLGHQATRAAMIRRRSFEDIMGALLQAQDIWTLPRPARATMPRS